MATPESPRPTSYAGSVRAALAYRKTLPSPKLLRVVVPVAIALLATIAIALAMAPEGDADFHFREEEGLVTTLSAVFLAMASGFAGTCFLVERRPEHQLRPWWLLTCMGFFFFACDELMRFHERTGTFLRSSVLGRPTYVFRNWNDVIVMSYGVVALFVMGFFAPRVLRIPLFAELLAIAFCSYVVHTVVDSLPHSGTGIVAVLAMIPSSILEESAKLFASTFFAVAMLNALLIVIAFERAPSSPPLPRAASERSGA